MATPISVYPVEIPINKGVITATTVSTDLEKLVLPKYCSSSFNETEMKF